MNSFPSKRPEVGHNARDFIIMAFLRILRMGEEMSGWKRLSCARRRCLESMSRGCVAGESFGDGSWVFRRRLKERRRIETGGMDLVMACRMHPRRRRRGEAFMARGGMFLSTHHDQATPRSVSSQVQN